MEVEEKMCTNVVLEDELINHCVHWTSALVSEYQHPPGSYPENQNIGHSPSPPPLVNNLVSSS